MSDPMDWPLTLREVGEIVEHLLNDGSRDGLILGDRLNTKMGASARRRALRELGYAVPMFADPDQEPQEAWRQRYDNLHGSPLSRYVPD